MTSSLLLAANFHPGVAVPIAVFVFVLIIVFISLYFRHERQRLWHETARIALEKGQPLPPPPDERGSYSYSHQHGPRSPLRDVRKALILLAVSIGLYIGLHEQGRQALIGSYITGGIGVAFLLNALITAIFAPKSTDTTRRPPQA